MTTFGDLVFELGGSPVGGRRYTSPWATHWFIDYDNGNDSGNSGQTPNQAKKLISSAVSLSSPGDVIYVRPREYVVGTGHARHEGAVIIPLTTSDLSIIGTGYPRNNEFGVRFKTTAGYGWTIEGPSSHIENIGFFVSAGTGSVIWDNNGATNTKRGSDGPVVYNCNFKGAISAKFVGGQAVRVLSSVFHGSGTYAIIIADPAVSGYGPQIRDCHFIDNTGTAATHTRIATAGGNCYGALIDGCYFGKVPTSVTTYIQFDGAQSTGLISNSHFSDDDLSASTSGADIIMPTGVKITGCYDDSGALIAST